MHRDEDCSLNGLVLTEVEVTLWHDPEHDNMRAFANLVLNDAFAVKAIRIVERSDGRLLVAMPNRKRPDDSHIDTFLPIHTQARRWIEDHILEAYVDSLNARHDAQVKALLEEAS